MINQAKEMFPVGLRVWAQRVEQDQDGHNYWEYGRVVGQDDGLRVKFEREMGERNFDYAEVDSNPKCSLVHIASEQCAHKNTKERPIESGEESVCVDCGEVVGSIQIVDLDDEE